MRTGKQYVGKAKSEKRFTARQGEHRRGNKKARCELTYLEKGVRTKHLKYYEEPHI